MPVYQRELYLNIPLYARLADDIGLVEHICDSIQPNIDAAFRAIEKQEFLYNPEIAPREWLQFLGQFVGLAIRNGKYLGFGLNPDWSDAHTRDVIQRAWAYWQIKGTELGIRTAIALWLQWEKALNPQDLAIHQPFSDRPADAPANWWTWDSTWDSHLIQTYEQRRHLGAEGLIRYRPNYQTLVEPHWYWEWGTLWCDPAIDCNFAPDIFGMRSHLGPHNSWLHFNLSESDWSKVFPDFFELAPEIFPATAMWSVFAWITPKAVAPTIKLKRVVEQRVDFIDEFAIDGFQYGIIDSSGDPTPKDNDLFELAGSLFPSVNFPATTTTTLVTTEIEFGVWLPEYWFGQWWYQTESRGHKIYTETLVLDLTEMLPIESLSIESIWQVDIDQPISNYGMAAEWFYKAYENYEYTQETTVTNPGTDCVSGITTYLEVADSPLPIDEENVPFVGITTSSGIIPGERIYFPGDGAMEALSGDTLLMDIELQIESSLEIDFTREPVAFALRKMQQLIEFIPPPNVADYFCEYNNQYPYICGFKQQNSLALPNLVSKKIRLCNVFGLWGGGSSIMKTRKKRKPTIGNKQPLSELYPLLGAALEPMGWRLVVETSEQLFLLSPITLFWYSNIDGIEKRSSTFSFEEGCTTLYLEFLLTSVKNTKIHSCTLWLFDNYIQHQTFYYPLEDQIQTHVGFKFNLPFGLQSGAATPSEEFAILEILPKLELKVVELDAIIARASATINQPIPTDNPPLEIEEADLMTELTQKLQTINFKLDQLIANPGVDAHYTYSIEIPVSKITIRHGLGKYPAVTFMESLGREESQVEVRHIDKNTVSIAFTPEASGWVTFN